MIWWKIFRGQWRVWQLQMSLLFPHTQTGGNMKRSGQKVSKGLKFHQKIVHRAGATCSLYWQLHTAMRWIEGQDYHSIILFFCLVKSKFVIRVAYKVVAFWPLRQINMLEPQTLKPKLIFVFWKTYLKFVKFLPHK